MSTRADMPIPIGLCQCGCGQETKAPKKTSRSRGAIKGVPFRFVKGHNMRRTAEDYVVTESGCWEWLRSVNRDGYGHAWCVKTKTSKKAHRLYYERLVGPIPQGMHLDHVCRNKKCVNPEHLEPITPLENTRRSRHAKLTMEDARMVRTSSTSGADLARHFGVAPSVISSIRRHRTWKDEPQMPADFARLNGFAA